MDKKLNEQPEWKKEVEKWNILWNKMRFGWICILVLVLIVGVIYLLDTDWNGSNPDKEVILQAADKLEKNEDYIISCNEESANGWLGSLEIVHGDDVYVEFPVDEEGNVIHSNYGESSSQQYALSEWSTVGGKSYMFTGDGTIYRLPQGYTDMALGRRSLFIRQLVENAYDITKEDPEVMTILGVSEKFDIYSMKVPSKDIKNLIGLQTYVLYDAVQQDSGKDTAVGKLCSYYKDELDFELVCSDANLLVGIDASGVLRYVSMEIGGNGLRSYITRVVMDFENSSVREIPDVSTSIDFSSTLIELANFVDSYDTYEEALEALDEMENSLSEPVENINDGEEDMSSED